MKVYKLFIKKYAGISVYQIEECQLIMIIVLVSFCSLFVPFLSLTAKVFNQDYLCCFNNLSSLHFIPYFIGINIKKLKKNTSAHKNVKVPPTVIAAFILAKQPMKMVLKLHLTKLKQLLAVDDFVGYKSTNNVVDVDNVLIAQYEQTNEVIKIDSILQPLSILQPNKR